MIKLHLPTKPSLNNPSLFGIFEDAPMPAALKFLDKELNGAIQANIKSGMISSKRATVSTFLNGNNPKAPLFIVNCGRKHDFTHAVWREAIQAALQTIKLTPIAKLSCYFADLAPKQLTEAQMIREFAESLENCFYTFDQFKSKKTDQTNLKTIDWHVSARIAKNEQAALEQGLAIGKGMTLCKDLANTPSNICTPTYLADAARKLAKQHTRVKVEVLSSKKMRALGMGALLAVSKGSREEPQFIILRYQGASKATKPIALVGKGITFDTGGNSLKPAESMVGMKYDMCGAATVLGTIHAAATLGLPLNVVGIVPAVENMPGGNAYKPEDILKSMSGQTIEVISTDAEGRLILADALTYCERFKPDVVIDIATLTGAVVIALGHHATGLMTNHQALADDLLAAGEKSLDRAWQLPLWEEYQKQINSSFADISNLGGKSAGSITAACFLSRFTKNFKWAHLDVAGTAAMMMGGSDRKANGRPVPLLVQYLINRSLR